MRIHFTFLFFLVLSFSQSQTKNEVEKRINTEDVPSNIIEDLNPHVKKIDKVKWYFQTDGKKNVYEGKFKQHSQKYSVEFDTLGKIANVEVIIKKGGIPNDIFKIISNKLRDTFKDYKIEKIQREYLGNEELFKVISNKNANTDLKIRYEILVNAKIENYRKLFEILFDSKGHIITKREVVVYRYFRLLFITFYPRTNVKLSVLCRLSCCNYFLF